MRSNPQSNDGRVQSRVRNKLNVARSFRPECLGGDGGLRGACQLETFLSLVPVLPSKFTQRPRQVMCLGSHRNGQSSCC